MKFLEIALAIPASDERKFEANSPAGQGLGSNWEQRLRRLETTLPVAHNMLVHPEAREPCPPPH